MVRKRFALVAAFVALSVLLWATGGVVADPPSPETEGEISAQGGVESAAVTWAINYQGRLTDAAGNPVPDGNYTIHFRLYNVDSGGTPLSTDTDTVSVSDGLFNAYLRFAPASYGGHFDGRALWLGIEVGSDGEMTPRQTILPVPYALSLRPGAVISNTDTTGHGLDVWSAAGGGRHGTALWVENTNTGSGIALWAVANGSDATLIAVNRGSGPLIKGFGGDGGEDEVRILNDGTFETKADSYLFIPGNEFIKNVDTDTTRWDCQRNGSVLIWRGATAGDKVIYIPITLPGVLYGQPVKVESITVYYKCQDGTKNYIAGTYLYKQTSADGDVTLISDYTDRTSDTATSYTLNLTADNILSSDQGILGLNLALHFVDNTHYIQIGGVRIQLGHHDLY